MLYPVFHAVKGAKTGKKGLETERSSQISQIPGNRNRVPAFPGIREIRFQVLSHNFSTVYRMECRVKRYSHPVGF